jgi:hypothetical protein
MVRIRLVGETLPRTQHADHTGLVAVEQMRKGNVPPASHWHLRYRHPGGCCLQADIDLGPQRLGHARTVTGIARRHRRKMLAATPHMRVGLAQPLQIMGETATGQYHPRRA